MLCFLRCLLLIIQVLASAKEIVHMNARLQMIAMLAVGGRSKPRPPLTQWRNMPRSNR